MILSLSSIFAEEVHPAHPKTNYATGSDRNSQQLMGGAEYLIITADRFYEAVQPLAEWKYKKGISTRVVKLSEVGGNNPELIKAYIINAHNNWKTKLEYVLLVGDINFIHPYNHPSCGQTDNPYADVSGDAELELSIGRLPCRNISQLRSMISKIFSYERVPYLADTLWFRKATTIRQDPGPYHNAGAQFVRSIILNNSSYQSVDSFVAPKHNALDVRDSLVRGRSYVLYLGHGGGSHWLEPFNVFPSVRNGKKFPIIFSWSCQTVLREGYLGQRWLKSGTVRNPYGAVAFIGTTTSGLYAPYRNFVARNFFRAIFEHRVENIGKALKEGLDSLWAYSPDSFGRTLYPEWNLLGDPELNLWTTVPKPMWVTHHKIILTGPQSFLVNVMTQDSTPMKNALVCIMTPNDSNFYYTGWTDNLGKTSFEINPDVQDSISITVTAQNFIPYEGSCTVSPVSLTPLDIVTKQPLSDITMENYLTGQAPTRSAISDVFCVSQSTTKSHLTIRLPSMTGYKTLKIFDASGNLIKVEELGSLNAKELQISLNGINPGVYFVSLETEINKETKKIILLK